MRYVRKAPVLCGVVPSTGKQSIWFWDKHARQYLPEMPFEQAIADHRFQTYVADAVCQPPEKRDPNQVNALIIAGAIVAPWLKPNPGCDK